MTLGRGLQSHCPVSLSIQWLSCVVLTLPLLGSRKCSLSMPAVYSQAGRLLRSPPSRSLSIFITPDSRMVCVRGTEGSILGPYLSCLLLPPWGVFFCVCGVCTYPRGCCTQDATLRASFSFPVFTYVPKDERREKSTPPHLGRQQPFGGLY